nr:MAG TPA: hypothetical protein [Caudoviricetes sp.]
MCRIFFFAISLINCRRHRILCNILLINLTIT